MIRRSTYLIVVFFLSIAAPLVAQKDYKSILQHLPDYSNREAIYRLAEFQKKNPKMPHPYYLLGNLYYNSYSEEHPLTDYDQLAQALYNVALYYGNCRSFLMNDRISKDLYPETARNGKVNEEAVVAFLNGRIDSIKVIAEHVDTLYASYCMMVNRYDSCLQDLTAFCSRYPGEKNALLMLDSADLVLLQQLEQKATRVQADIKRFKQALADYPIAGYNPTFEMVPIRYYKMEGLTTVNFLQNEVKLWDYAAYSRRLLDTYDTDIAAYHAALEEGWEAARPEAMVNLIKKMDPASPMADLFHLKQLYQSAQQLTEQIMHTDTISEEDWLPLFQRTYRIHRLEEEAGEMVGALQPRLNAPEVLRKYDAFVGHYFPEDDWKHVAASVHAQLLSLYRDQVIPFIYSHSDAPAELQISETTMAHLIDNNILFLPINE